MGYGSGGDRGIDVCRRADVWRIRNLALGRFVVLLVFGGQQLPDSAGPYTNKTQFA
jgi:hypothetical protein